jgi:hypothetical protein
LRTGLATAAGGCDARPVQWVSLQASGLWSRPFALHQRFMARRGFDRI